MTDHADVIREGLHRYMPEHVVCGCEDCRTLAALDALVAEKATAIDIMRAALGRAEAAEQAARRVPALDAEIDRLGLYCRSQEALVTELEAAATKVTDAYTAEAEDHNDEEFALWKADDLINAIVALRAVLPKEVTMSAFKQRAASLGRITEYQADWLGRVYAVYENTEILPVGVTLPSLAGRSHITTAAFHAACLAASGEEA